MIPEPQSPGLDTASSIAEWHRAVVLENIHLTWDIVQIALSPLREGGLPFRSGQYLFVRTQGGDWRPFSIASAPSHPSRVELCIRRVGGGTVSPLLAGVRAGEEVEYQGPHGGFALHGDERRLFVATGTGIAPLRSMILDTLKSEESCPVLLVFGNHSREDLFYDEFFQTLERTHRSFRFVPCLSRPGTSPWPGETGRVIEVLPRVLEEPRCWSAYVCGRDEMITQTFRVLADLGVPPERLYREPV